MAIDGPVAADAAALADAVAEELRLRARPCARVRAEDFLRARSLRLEHGRDDPDAFFDGWYDLAALRREVLDPMRPGPGVRSWLPRLRDPDTDRPYRDQRRTAARGTVLVLDGRFLGRPDVVDAIDLLVHLDVSAAGRIRRAPSHEHARLLPAWQRYLTGYDPAAAAAVVVRYDRPGHPAVLLPAG